MDSVIAGSAQMVVLAAEGLWEELGVGDSMDSVIAGTAHMVELAFE